MTDHAHDEDYLKTQTHTIAPGSAHDESIESDPRSINRNKKVAPMPEVCGKSLSEASHSGGGINDKQGSGKGPLDHDPKSKPKGKDKKM